MNVGILWPRLVGKDHLDLVIVKPIIPKCQLPATIRPVFTIQGNSVQMNLLFASNQNHLNRFKKRKVLKIYRHILQKLNTAIYFASEKCMLCLEHPKD
jgi:hypothetical protein